MANVTTLAKGGTTGVAASNRGPQIVTHEIDIAAATAAGVTTGGYVTIVNIPVDTYFRMLQIEVVDAISLDASSSRVDVGDVADDDEFVSNATTLTAGTNLTLIKGDGTEGDVYKIAAETIRLKLTGDKLAGGTANATGKIRFVWLQGDASRNATAVAS